MSIRFNYDDGSAHHLQAWRKSLEDDRAGRAMLRRADSILAITICPAYRRLYRGLCEIFPSSDIEKPWIQDRLALIAGTLAQVKEFDGKNKVAKAMSFSKLDKPAVSELRFKRLLESPDMAALFVGLRRVLPLLQAECAPDIVLLSNDILHWGDQVKKDWTYAYAWTEKTTSQ